MKKIALLAGLVSLAGCASSPTTSPVRLTEAFSVDEVSFVKSTGTARVQGKAFIKLEDGSDKGCSGFHTELLPAGRYANERIYKIYKNNQSGQILMSQNPPKFDPDIKEYHEYVIKTECDADNKFEFKNVPAGDYYVIAFIIWGDKPNLQGGAVMQRLNVAKSSVHQINLGE